MHFDFSDEQYAIRDVARDVFEREWSAAALRERWSSDDPGDGRVWKALASVGILGLPVPEATGGAGGDVLDLALVLEEAGRAGVPDPLVDTLAVAAPLLAESGDERWLPGIAAGEVVLGAQLEGQPFVADADVASLVLLQLDEEIHAVPAERLRIERVTTEDRARRLFAAEADLGPETLLTGDAATIARALGRGAAATANLLNGVSGRMLEMTLEHVKARYQFGRPVGSFQAVKHKLSSMHVALDASRAAAWYAAYALARGLPDAIRAASVAKASASETAALVGGDALQLHGGIGFTWEHDLHLWLKRAKALEASYGSARDHRARLAAALLEERGTTP